MKKPAGRPPKALQRKKEERKGILTTPSNPSLIFELVHDNPDMFKAIFDACKKISETLHFVISPEGMKLFCKSKTQGCFSLIEIFGEKVVGYYCKEVRYYKCLCKSALSILKSKKKGQEKIKFTILNSKSSIMKITMTTNDQINESSALQLDTDEYFDLSYYEKIYEIRNEYPLIFSLKWAYFKELLNNWDIYKPKAIFFEKDAESNLLIKILEEITCEAEFENSESIELLFNSEDLISVGIPTLHISAVSPSVSLSKKLTFYISEQNEMILSAKIDEIYSTRDTTIEDTESATVKFFIQLKQMY
jgi:hypothetical protein